MTNFPAHFQLYPDLSIREVLGKFCADALADRGADFAEIGANDAKPYLYHIATLTRVQLRLVAILRYIVTNYPRTHSRPATDPITPPPAHPTPTLLSAVLCSTHAISNNGAQLRCLRCHHVQPARNTQPVRQWLMTPCTTTTPLGTQDYRVEFEGSRRIPPSPCIFQCASVPGRPTRRID